MLGTSPIALRAHHLLCMLTFAGDGYSPEFVRNFSAIVERIRRGNSLTLVDGPDDVCAAMPDTGEALHCRNASVAWRDDTARAALAAIPGLRVLLDGGTVAIDAALATRLREDFAAGAIRAACTGCEWSGLCTTIARRSFARTALAGGDDVDPLAR